MLRICLLNGLDEFPVVSLLHARHQGSHRTDGLDPVVAQGCQIVLVVEEGEVLGLEVGVELEQADGKGVTNIYQCSCIMQKKP